MAAPGAIAAAGARPGPPGLAAPAWVRWARANLFNTWVNSAVTLLAVYFLGKLVVDFVSWGVVNAIWWVPDNNTESCREAKGVGACWAFVAEKWRFILFATYPFEEQWRPALACAIFVVLYVVSSMRRFWNVRLLYVWLAGLAAIGLLMWGGAFGLRYVENERWGGLVVTLLLATFGIAFAFPVAILAALGRRSDMPAIRAICVGYIELIRGVPLVSLLFMASVMFPLFLPQGLTIDKLLRAQVAIILFAAAYLAEVIRGGLQAIPKGQYEAADSLGLGYWQKTRLIVLPQALRLVIPPMVNTFIGLFKDTSLVVIIGLFDLLNAVKIGLQEPAWRGFSVEAYIAVSVIYFAFCYAMSKYSQGIEADFARRRNR